MNLETNMGIEDMWKILKKQEAKKKSRLRDAPMNVTGILYALLMEIISKHAAPES